MTDRCYKNTSTLLALHCKDISHRLDGHKPFSLFRPDDSNAYRKRDCNRRENSMTHGKSYKGSAYTSEVRKTIIVFATHVILDIHTYPIPIYYPFIFLNVKH